MRIETSARRFMTRVAERIVRDVGTHLAGCSLELDHHGATWILVRGDPERGTLEANDASLAHNVALVRRYHFPSNALECNTLSRWTASSWARRGAAVDWAMSIFWKVLKKFTT